MLRRSFVSSSRCMSTFLGETTLPRISNEPFLHYPPGSKERKELRAEFDKQSKKCPHVPCILNGKDVKTGNVEKQLIPHNHKHAVCTFETLTPDLVDRAIEGAMAVKPLWERMSLDDRSSIFLKAADLLSTKYRATLNAAVMLGQSKTVWQAEIDAAVETIDFWRFGAKFSKKVYQTQPPENDFGVWNRMEYRPLEGFVAAITPFNFIAIAANLPSTPALMGNVCLWKPAENSVHAAKIIYDILVEAGLPDGVIQFLPGDGKDFAAKTLGSRDLAGVHFTGSTPVFNSIWKTAAQNLEMYRSYPRMVGETGGKNFLFIHKSADVKSVINQSIRGAFEFQGQKCSASSRMYVPKSLWPEIRDGMVAGLKRVKMGDPGDFTNFMAAVINKRAFDRISGYINRAKQSDACEIVAGGRCDESVGYFIEPTVILTKDPKYESIREEIFGPVMTVYVYEDDEFAETLKLCDETSPYGLTGSIFARDRVAVAKASAALRYATGNFYINDKSTGSIVGQQPFGGARMSGTNDKSGSASCYMRFCSPRSIKENFLPLDDFGYPSMQGDPREDDNV